MFDDTLGDVISFLPDGLTRARELQQGFLTLARAKSNGYSRGTTWLESNVKSMHRQIGGKMKVPTLAERD